MHFRRSVAPRRPIQNTNTITAGYPPAANNIRVVDVHVRTTAWFVRHRTAINSYAPVEYARFGETVFAPGVSLLYEILRVERVDKSRQCRTVLLFEDNKLNPVLFVSLTFLDTRFRGETKPFRCIHITL